MFALQPGVKSRYMPITTTMLAAIVLCWVTPSKPLWLVYCVQRTKGQVKWSCEKLERSLKPSTEVRIRAGNLWNGIVTRTWKVNQTLYIDWNFTYSFWSSVIPICRSVYSDLPKCLKLFIQTSRIVCASQVLTHSQSRKCMQGTESDEQKLLQTLPHQVPAGKRSSDSLENRSSACVPKHEWIHFFPSRLLVYSLGSFYCFDLDSYIPHIRFVLGFRTHSNCIPGTQVNPSNQNISQNCFSASENFRSLARIWSFLFIFRSALAGANSWAVQMLFIMLSFSPSKISITFTISNSSFPTMWLPKAVSSFASLTKNRDWKIVLSESLRRRGSSNPCSNTRTAENLESKAIDFSTPLKSNKQSDSDSSTELDPKKYGQYYT